ncbi:MAG: heme-binding domain-containing protein [Archangiaceae bacterium]|nr:heme-binding domain-containing protein [Archangiaceae bacterium]
MSRNVKILGALVGVFVVMQLVPYGRDHTNPPVKAEPQWTSPEVRALAVRACFDCHSNETKWPGYSNVAPVSWLVQHHVDEGRHELNFSEFDRPQKHAKDAEEELREGEMPMGGYVAMHGEAKLTDAEKKQLGEAFIAMFGSEQK